MRIGQFFSLQGGRVGQYLSDRVLVIRTPFRPTLQQEESCCFGFDHIRHAQRFAQRLAGIGYGFQVRRSRWLPHLYEVTVPNSGQLAQQLAHSDRLPNAQLS